MFPILRWCLIANAIWLIGIAGFVSMTHISAKRHLRIANTWTPKIATTSDLDAQKQISLQLLKAVENRIAAVKALQRSVISFGAVGAALSAFNFLFLLQLHHRLRREVHYTIDAA